MNYQLMNLEVHCPNMIGIRHNGRLAGCLQRCDQCAYPVISAHIQLCRAAPTIAELLTGGRMGGMTGAQWRR